MNSFFSSLKDIFWFSTPASIREREGQDEDKQRDVFFLSDGVVGYEERIKALQPYIEKRFDEPEITINDVSVMENYIDLNMDVRTEQGKFRLVYYDNDELIFRGNSDIVKDLKEPLSKRLGLTFRRI